MYIRGISQPIRMRSETVWNGIFFDITDRKRAEEALTTSHFLETRYRSFFEDACNGVLIYQPVAGGEDYLITDVNRATADLLRMDRLDLIGKRLFEEFPDIATPELRETLKRVLNDGPARGRPPDQVPEPRRLPLDLALHLQAPVGRARLLHDRRLGGAGGDAARRRDGAEAAGRLVGLRPAEPRPGRLSRRHDDGASIADPSAPFFPGHRPTLATAEPDRQPASETDAGDPDPARRVRSSPARLRGSALETGFCRTIGRNSGDAGYVCPRPLSKPI